MYKVPASLAVLIATLTSDEVLKPFVHFVVITKLLKKNTTPGGHDKYYRTSNQSIHHILTSFARKNEIAKISYSKNG